MASKPTQGWAFFLFSFPVFLLLSYRQMFMLLQNFLGPESRIDASSRHEVEEMH